MVLHEVDLLLRALDLAQQLAEGLRHVGADNESEVLPIALAQQVLELGDAGIALSWRVGTRSDRDFRPIEPGVAPGDCGAGEALVSAA